MSKTKVIGVLMIISAIVSVGVDALDGNGFDIASHMNSLIIALNGAGFYFLRDALKKIQGALNKWS